LAKVRLFIAILPGHFIQTQVSSRIYEYYTKTQDKVLPRY